MNALDHSSGKMYWIMTAAITVIIAVSFISSPPVSDATSSSSTVPGGLMVPLYSYPGATWRNLILAKQSNPTVPVVAVINPNNGPGGSKDPNFVKGIKNLQAAGITVLGYVDTNYARVSENSVKSQVSRYKTWYGVNGIFFDCMWNQKGDEIYYSTVSNYAHSLGLKMTVGNPGTSIAASYIGTVNILVIYESSGYPSVSYLAHTTSGHSKSNFAFIAYSVGKPSSTYVTSTLKYVSWMYITNAGGSNPYNSLPSYLSTLMHELTLG